MNKEALIKLLKKEVVPVVGCTEPVAVALAGAHAYQKVPGKIKNISVLVSPNIYKNTKSVVIPWTGSAGVNLAAALGASIINPSMDLNILASVKPVEVKRAKELVEKEIVNVSIRDNPLPAIYIQVAIETTEGKAEAIIIGRHDNLALLKSKGRVIIDNRAKETEKEVKLPLVFVEHSLTELLDYVLSIDPSGLEFLLEGIDMNMEIARTGLGLREGLGIGPAWMDMVDKGLVANKDFPESIAYYTAAACDARMSGIHMPVMSSAGSGNQGLIAIIPIALAVEEFNTPLPITIKALTISHLVTAYIKSFTGRLSPICGAGLAAGTGSGAGLSYLMGGAKVEISRAMKNVISSLSGMICDGAKIGCAFKLYVSAAMAWHGAILAKEGVEVPHGNGIIVESIEDTIYNLGRISKEGMANVDKTVLSILSSTTAIV